MKRLGSWAKNKMAELAGHPVHKDFEIQDQIIATGGPYGLWRIYPAVDKASAVVGRESKCSVWFLDKRDPLCNISRSDSGATGFSKFPKEFKEAFLDVMRRGPQQLVKCRHPNLLRIVAPLSESKDQMAFVTEEIFASVSNVPLHIKEYDLHPLEIKCGILQVSDALHFCERKLECAHGNLTPEAIMITSTGDWKLGGFSFFSHARYGEAGTGGRGFSYNDEIPRKVKDEDHALAQRVLRLQQPDLDYLAPEYIMQGRSTATSDIFSLALLIFAVNNRGETLPQYRSNGNLLGHKSNAESISRITTSDFCNVPQEFHNLMKIMLNVEPTVRPKADDFARAPAFDDPLVKALKYLGAIGTKADQSKAQFFKGLSKAIKDFPKRLAVNKIIPCIVPELQNNLMVPFILPCIFEIASLCTMVEYDKHIFPCIAQDPVQIVMLLLKNMELLMKMTPPDKARDHVLPMVYRAIESGNPEVQEMAVVVLPSFKHAVEYSVLKSEILPRVGLQALKGSTTDLRINSLVCIGKIMDALDKWVFQEKIMKALSMISSNEPGILMAVLGIFQTAFKDPKMGIQDPAILCKTIIPKLVVNSSNDSLNSRQFSKHLNVVKDMIKFVEDKRIEELSKKEGLANEAHAMTNGNSSATVSSMTEVMAGDGDFSNTFDVQAAMKKAAESDADKAEQLKSKMSHIPENLGSLATRKATPGLNFDFADFNTKSSSNSSNTKAQTKEKSFFH
eukprot:UC4_evm1s355